MEEKTSNIGSNPNTFLSFFIKNKKKLYVFFIVALTIISIIFFIKIKNDSDNSKVSEQFNTARIYIENQKNNEGKEILLEIIKKKNKFYSPLSLNYIIEHDLEKNYITTLGLFNTVLDINGLDIELKNLISYKKALFLINIDSSASEIVEVLNQIINSESVWKKNSASLLMDFYKNKGDDLKSEQYKNLLMNTK
jgi:hypothetical protein